MSWTTLETLASTKSQGQCSQNLQVETIVARHLCRGCKEKLGDLFRCQYVQAALAHDDRRPQQRLRYHQSVATVVARISSWLKRLPSGCSAPDLVELTVDREPRRWPGRLVPVDERPGFEEFLDGEERLGRMALDLTFEVQGLKESILEPPELVVPCW